jgi:hypothetical protein
MKDTIQCGTQHIHFDILSEGIGSARDLYHCFLDLCVTLMQIITGALGVAMGELFGARARTP